MNAASRCAVLSILLGSGLLACANEDMPDPSEVDEGMVETAEVEEAGLGGPGSAEDEGDPSEVAEVFRVNQEVNPSVDVPSGTNVCITYSWPGGGALVDTQWGSLGREMHATTSNVRTVCRVLTNTCRTPMRVNVFTQVTKGNDDHGSAAIALFVRGTAPCN